LLIPFNFELLLQHYPNILAIPHIPIQERLQFEQLVITLIVSERDNRDCIVWVGIIGEWAIVYEDNLRKWNQLQQAQILHTLRWELHELLRKRCTVLEVQTDGKDALMGVDELEDGVCVLLFSGGEDADDVILLQSLKHFFGIRTNVHHFLR
jgi:hypothetical protein